MTSPKHAAPPLPRLATIWLGGCSGCHMSFVDLDEWLIELRRHAQIVYGPLVDRKEFPEDVDAVLVEGAVTNTDNLELAHQLRARSKVVISFGDCAVTGNVTALRNLVGEPGEMVYRVYAEHPDRDGQMPSEVIPDLLPQALPLHHVVPVDLFLPGCPPPAARIREALESLLGIDDSPHGIRFG